MCFYCSVSADHVCPGSCINKRHRQKKCLCLCLPSALVPKRSVRVFSRSKSSCPGVSPEGLRSTLRSVDQKSSWEKASQDRCCRVGEALRCAMSFHLRSVASCSGKSPSPGHERGSAVPAPQGAPLGTVCLWGPCAGARHQQRDPLVSLQPVQQKRSGFLPYTQTAVWRSAANRAF